MADVCIECFHIWSKFKVDFQQAAICLSQHAPRHLFVVGHSTQVIVMWLYSCINAGLQSICVILQLNCHPAATEFLLHTYQVGGR